MTRIFLREGSRARRAGAGSFTFAAFLSVALATGCASAPLAVPVVSSPASVPQPATSAPADSGSRASSASSATCDRPVLESYRPPSPMPAPGQMATGSTMAAIQKRGYLIAGVDQDEYDWGFPNPNPDAPAGEKYLGFDIDLLHALAYAIFGNQNAIEFVPVSQDFRMGAANQGTVDVVADSITINCQRSKQVMFSVDYFDAHEKVLVPKDNTTISVSGPPYAINGVKGEKICTVGSTTSVTNLTALVPTSHFSVVLADNWSDCLALLQEGAVQAFSTDDSILSGIAAEDPYVKFAPGPVTGFSNEPHGLAFPMTTPGGKSNEQLVAFANGVLLSLESSAHDANCPEPQIAADKSCWAALYRTWVEAQLSPGTVPPPPTPTFIPG
jgi:polar amino acid transport system substrate-binding protein